jgi:hypothetical protein
MSAVRGGEYRFSFLLGEYWRLAQPVVRSRGDEEFPELGKDTLTFILRNITDDTEATIDFLAHHISILVTDPDIEIRPNISALALSSGSNYTFAFRTLKAAPIVIINGGTVIVPVESDGITYNVVLSDISEDMEISIHTSASSPPPPTAVLTPFRPDDIDGTITVYTLQGRVWASGKADDVFPLPAGVYLVKAGTEIRKVVCR